MKNIPLTMVRHDLCNIPEPPLPEGFQLKFFKQGDEKSWAEIETRAGEFEDTWTGLERYHKEFGAYVEEMSQRCLFIENPYGEKIGTATAWMGDLDEKNKGLGRIHWVGIIPEYQGKKLSKPLLSAALKRLSQYHSKAYLTSQTTSFQAVNMYLNYGFEPFIESTACDEAWSLLEQVLQREIL